MVLLKRKAVEYSPLKTYFTTSTECWEIKETGELFDNYDDYLSRRDYYRRKLFTCEITGRTGLDFFEALDSEVHGTREIKTSFPESLRQPILREVHHRTEQRLEQLVNLMHERFKNEYYPGEQVHVSVPSDQTVEGKIREKLVVSSGAPVYTITINLETPENSKDIQVEGQKIRRDRRNFNKNLLRGFLRDSLTKEAWHGSPWCVKDAHAKEFGLPLAVPEHLQHSAIVDKRKAHALQKKLMQQQQLDANKSMGIITDFRQYPGSKKNGHMMPIVPSGPGVMQPVWQSKPGGKQKHRFIQNGAHQNNGPKPQFVEYKNGPPMDLRMSHYAPNADGNMEPVMISHNGQVAYTNGTGPTPTKTVAIHRKQQAMSPPLPPPLKYPTEDLDVPPKEQDPSRPELHSFTDLELAGEEGDEDCPTGKYEATSVGLLLEVWNTLNVHNEVFVLDSFTFDDLAQALRFSSPDYDCELLNETHCAVLKQFVNEEGKLLIDLPKMQEESSSEESETSEAEVEEEPEPEPEPEPPRRTTRSSLRQEEAKALAQQRSPTPPDPLAHQAEELNSKMPWQDRCKNRDFRNNAWQAVMAGFLYHLSLNPRIKNRCDTILCELLPLDEPATDETVIRNYAKLNVNLRLRALEIMTKMTISTKAIREHLEEMTHEMTDLRKRRIDEQRARKDYHEELQALNEKRKNILKEIEDKKSPEEKAKEAAAAAAEEQEDTPIPDAPSVNGDASDSDSSAQATRLLRKRKRGQEAAPKPKPRGRPTKVKRSKEEIELTKVLDQMEKKKESIKECEEKIEDLTNDLRETDCQRTRCLGKDRFCNRYWWYERNGMPYGGVPSSSTADYGYANARIWVQGPYEDDLNGMLDVTPEQAAGYKAEYGVSILERRETEEGATHLAGADHYGYIDTPEQLDKLIAWLDDRGKREKSLKKELTNWREMIGECMEKLQQHLSNGDVSDEEASSSKPATRVSTRTKSYADLSGTGWKCLKWTNSVAVEQLGMRHGEGKKSARRGVAARKVPEKKVVAAKEKILLDRRGKSTKRGR